MGRLPFEKKFIFYDLAIDNALNNSDILSELSARGYNEAKLSEGKAFLTEAKRLHEKQKVGYGEQFDATKELNRAIDEADKQYSKTMKLARLAYKNNPMAMSTLRLVGQRKESNTGWLEQAEALYKNLVGSEETGLKAGVNPIEGMKKYGYSEESLKKEYEMIKKVIELNKKQKNNIGEAQRATECNLKHFHHPEI